MPIFTFVIIEKDVTTIPFSQMLTPLFNSPKLLLQVNQAK